MAVWVWRSLSDRSSLSVLIRTINIRLGQLSDILVSLFALAQGVGTITNGAALPSIAGASVWTVNNVAPTNILGFVDGTPGQEVLLWSTTANTTLKHSASLRMKGAADVTMTAVETRRFTTVDGTNWRET